MSDSQNSTFKKIAFLASTALIILAALAIVVWDIATWQQRGWTGMIVEEKTVDFIFDGSPAQKAGILDGDSILAVSGFPADSLVQIKSLATQTKKGQKYTYLVARDGKQLALTLTLESPFMARQVLVNLISGLPVGFIFLAIGYFVYFKQPYDRRARIFCMMSVFAAAFFFINSLSSLSLFGIGTSLFSLVPNKSASAFMIAGIVLLSLLLALLLMHLSLIFPKERPVVRNNPYVFRWLYGLPILWPLLIAMSVVMILAHGVGTITFKMTDPPTKLALPFELEPTATLIFIALVLGLMTYFWQRSKKVRKAVGLKKWLWMHPLQSMLLVALVVFVPFGSSSALVALFNIPKFVPLVFLLILMLPSFGGLITVSWGYTISTCISVYRSYREANVEEKRQVKWPLWGIMLALAGSILAAILGVIIVIVLDRSGHAFMFTLTGVLQNAFYVIIPISFAIGILKYRLMDIDLIIKKTIIYSVVTGLLVLLFFGLAGGLGGFLVQSTGLQNQWMVIFSTLAVALVFVPLRNRVQEFIDRRFYRKKHDYPQILKQLGSEVHEAADQKNLLQCVAENLQQTLPNRATVIFLKSPSDQNFLAKAKIGLPDEVLGQLKIAPSSPLISEIDGVSQPQQADLPEVDRHILQQIRADVLVPVKTKNALIGLISLGKKLSDLDYDEDDREYLLSVVEHLAIGLEHVRLREQEKEFEQAREIQQRLLPSVIPQIVGVEIAAAWQPARAVSGDYYDFLRLSNTKLGICVGDVVGKGMPAALLMSNLQAAVKSFTSEQILPKELCEKTNSFLKNNMDSDKFITFFFGVLNSEEKSFVYSRAGHNPPFLIRKDGSVLLLETGGPALGILSNVQYQQEQITLKLGERIFIFTDGVNEAMNDAEEEFGEERLTILLKNNCKLGATELQKCVMHEVAEFTNGVFQDDVTMIVISVD